MTTTTTTPAAVKRCGKAHRWMPVLLRMWWGEVKAWRCSSCGATKYAGW